MPRFSKASVASYFGMRAMRYQNAFAFNPNNGTAQLGAKTRKEKELVSAASNYGYWRGMQEAERVCREWSEQNFTE